METIIEIIGIYETFLVFLMCITLLFILFEKIGNSDKLIDYPPFKITTKYFFLLIGTKIFSVIVIILIAKFFKIEKELFFIYIPYIAIHIIYIMFSYPWTNWAINYCLKRFDKKG